MIVPLLVFLGTAAVFAYLAVQWDIEGRKALADGGNRVSITLWGIIKHRVLGLWFYSSSQQQVLPITNAFADGDVGSPTQSAEELMLRRDQKDRARTAFQLRIKGKAVGSEHSILDDSLPKVFRAGGLFDKFVVELQRHHRWLSIIYYFSAHYPRVLRVLALATNVITFLFFVAITYSAANPDDNSCATFLSADDCHAPKSDFATGHSECLWDNRKETCTFIQPNVVIRIILFVAIFALILATPINMVTNWLVKHVLAAPLVEVESAASKYAIQNTTAGEHDSNEAGASHTPPAQSLVGTTHSSQDPLPTSAATATATAANTTEHTTSHNNNLINNQNNSIINTQDATNGFIKDKPSTQSTDAPSQQLTNKYRSGADLALQELASLESDIRQHREANLKSLIDRRKFDRIWGLVPSGHFLKADTPKASNSCQQRLFLLLGPDPAPIRTAVLHDITRAQRLERHQIDCIKRTYMSESEVGKVLLFCLQCDLLEGIEGTIVESKGRRDAEPVFPVHWQWKVLAWVAIIALDVAFLAYIFSFAATQPSPRQSAWFKSFVLYLALEIAGISTNHVFITHFALPCLAFRRAQWAKELLCKRIQKHSIDVEKSLLAATPGSATSVSVVKNEQTQADSGTFNAAQYLYVSHRLSLCFPYVKESAMVRICSTQVPRQAQFLETEVKTTTVEETVDKAMRDHTWENFLFFLTAAGATVYMLFVPALQVALAWPQLVQDAVLEWITVVLFGYILLLHIRLYEIYPLVAFLPVFVFMVVGHFYVVSGNAEVQVNMAKLKTDALKARAEQRKLQEKRFVIEAQHAEEVSAKNAPPGSNNNSTKAQDAKDITPVHESVKRASALRATASAASNTAKSSSRGSSAPPTPSAGQNKAFDGLEGQDDSEKFQSRLHHFMASADKVLQAQQEHVVAAEAKQAESSAHSGAHGHLHGNGSLPNLRAVDSFYQQKAATTPKAEADAPSNDSTTPVAGGQQKRLVKKASFQDMP